MDRSDVKDLAFGLFILVPTFVILLPLLLIARWVEAKASETKS